MTASLLPVLGALSAIGLGGAIDAAPVRKCASALEGEGYSVERPLVVIDGRRAKGEGAELDPGSEAIGWLAVECWDPTTGRLGVAVGIPTVYIVSQRLVDAMADAVAELVEAQKQHFDAEGRYMEGASDLGLAGGPFAIRIERADGEGWSGSVSPWGVAYECRVSKHADGREGEPRCLGLRELADEGREVTVLKSTS